MGEQEVEIIEMTRKEFEEHLSKLGEYSCSLPSATTIGKRWLCNDDAFAPEPRRSIARAEEKMAGVFPNWWMGEYYELDPPVPSRVGIRWRKIKLKELFVPPEVEVGG